MKDYNLLFTFQNALLQVERLVCLKRMNIFYTFSIE